MTPAVCTLVLFDPLPVGEVHPCDVHPVLDELQQDLRGPGHRADGAHDTRQTHPNQLFDQTINYVNNRQVDSSINQSINQYGGVHIIGRGMV